MRDGGMRRVSRDLGTLFEAGCIGGLSDAELLERFSARREEAAFEAIARRHGPMVWGACRRVLRDDHDAEDAFQATFLVLVRRADSVRPREKLADWLYGVAYRTALKARAMRAKRRSRESRVSEVPEPSAISRDPGGDLADSLDQALSRLPEKYRIPIVLCELEGRSHREAAEQLGWPVGTVSGRLSRARAMLARRLSGPGVSLSVGSLAVLLARDIAEAGVPPKLIDSTARAASLVAAGRAVTAGMVSAEVAALAGEVMKTMALKRLFLVGSFAAAAVIVAASVALALPRDPQPAKPPPAPAAGGFRRESVGVDELLEHTGLNIYKFVAQIPKGTRFRVLWLDVNRPDGGTRALYVGRFRKETDDATTVTVSFLRRDRKMEGVLLSDEKEADFRLNCPGCDPSGIATVVRLPLTGVELAQKMLIVHRFEDPNYPPVAKGMRLITLRVTEPGRVTPSQLPADAPRGELIIEFEE